MRRRPLVLGVLLLAGCLHLEDPAPPQETRLVVHAVLNTNAGQQYVLVYRARTGVPNAVEGGSLSDDEPVTDALITVTGADGTTYGAVNVANPSGECCVSGTYIIGLPPLLPMPVTGARTYDLRVRTPLGEEVTGTTTVPGPAQPIQDPTRIFFRLRDTLRLSWPRVPGAASYEVVIRMPRFDQEYRTFADTSFTIAGTALTITGDEIFERGQDASVLVSAVDVNYYDYYRSQSDPFAGAAPSHLTGAVGVFGSIVPIYATQLVVR
jgi:hypothetical protein